MTDDGLFPVDDVIPALPGSVHDAYSNAVEELRRTHVLKTEHEGLAANLLRLGRIIDNERKGYAVAHASSQAHDIMKTLLALVPPETGDAFTDLMKRLEQTAPGRQDR